MDSKMPETGQSTVFHHGGSIMEKAFQSGSQCGGRVFSMDYDCLSLAQLIWAIGNTRTTANDHFRSAVATMVNAWNRLVLGRSVGIDGKTTCDLSGTDPKRQVSSHSTSETNQWMHERLGQRYGGWRVRQRCCREKVVGRGGRGGKFSGVPCMVTLHTECYAGIVDYQVECMITRKCYIWGFEGLTYRLAFLCSHTPVGSMLAR